MASGHLLQQHSLQAAGLHPAPHGPQHGPLVSLGRGLGEYENHSLRHQRTNNIAFQTLHFPGSRRQHCPRSLALSVAEGAAIRPRGISKEQARWEAHRAGRPCGRLSQQGSRAPRSPRTTPPGPHLASGSRAQRSRLAVLTNPKPRAQCPGDLLPIPPRASAPATCAQQPQPRAQSSRLPVP